MGGIWLPDNGQLIYRPLNCNRENPDHNGGHTYTDRRSGHMVVGAAWPATLAVDGRGCVQTTTGTIEP